MLEKNVDLARVIPICWCWCWCWCSKRTTIGESRMILPSRAQGQGESRQVGAVRRCTFRLPQAKTTITITITLIFHLNEKYHLTKITFFWQFNCFYSQLLVNFASTCVQLTIKVGDEKCAISERQP